MLEGRAFKPSLRVQSKARVEGRVGDADLSISRCHFALRGGNVGPAFEQVRRKPDGNRWRSCSDRFDRYREAGGIRANKNSYRMLKLCAGNAKIGRKRLRILQRILGFDHRDLIVDSGVVERLSA